MISKSLKKKAFFSSDYRIGNIFDTASAIEMQSWKYLDGSPRINTDEFSKDFFKTFLKKLSSKGWLDSWFLLLNKKPIAYAFNINFDNKKYAYNSAYCSSTKEIGPGSLLHVYRIKDAFNDNFKEYDFLRGTEDYKLEWTDTLREIYEYCIFNANFKSKLLGKLFIKLRWHFARIKLIKNIRSRLLSEKIKYQTKKNST